MWKISIDTGGTFTDCLCTDPNGTTKRFKVLSDGSLRVRVLESDGNSCKISPFPFPFEPILSGYTASIGSEKTDKIQISDYDAEENLLTFATNVELSVGQNIHISGNESAPILAARIATGTPLGQTIPIEELRLATTLGTNALLERKGANVALLITKGFKDLLKIGDQSRPDLFQLNIPERETFTYVTIEVDERTKADGRLEKEISDKEIDRVKDLLYSHNIDSVAVSFLNSYKYPFNELHLGESLKLEFPSVSMGHLLSNNINFLSRTTTCVINAYLDPILNKFARNFSKWMPKADIYFMQSNGHRVRQKYFHPKDSLLSGPAGGVIGSEYFANKLNRLRLIGVDMGGTSTDTSLIDRKALRRNVFSLGINTIQVPTLDIDTVAAGGGSICQWTSNGYAVGPESSGAYPGPACYGHGGPLCLTDIALLKGRMYPDLANIPMDLKSSKIALSKALAESNSESSLHPDELTDLFLTLGVETMASSIEKISVKRGIDPREFDLFTFGGAGGLFACDLAEYIGMKELICPLESGVLSAVGLLHARQGFIQRINIGRDLIDEIKQIKSTISKACNSYILKARHMKMSNPHIDSIVLQCRMKGQAQTLDINFDENLEDSYENAFRKKFKVIYGYFPPNSSVECVSARIELTEKDEVTHSTQLITSRLHAKPIDHLINELNGNKTAVYVWKSDLDYSGIKGPAIFVNTEGTVYLKEGWKCSASYQGNLICSQAKVVQKLTFTHKLSNASLFAHRFTHIADEMGVQLNRTAVSPNIKERMDYSCAILDANGKLLVNAPHIPVHLGSMGISLRLILQEFSLENGDILIYNHPAYGGSHLPDITLAKGVYDEFGNLFGYVVNRAHHAEIGGMSPGSMPVKATKLFEEGVVIKPFYLAKNGDFNWDELRSIFDSAPYPSRSTDLNIADIKAAVASLETGENKLLQLIQTYGHDQLKEAAQSIFQLAINGFTERLGEIQDNHLFAEEILDDGARISLNIHKKGDLLEFDFSGTSGVQEGNLNANLSIVYSAVLYSVRLWVGEDIPLNDGLMERIRINLPNSMLNPDYSDDQTAPATAAGNTELSQRLTDTILKAFKLAACSQGTMNNILFGNSTFGYYETIGGGAGATHNSRGRSAVHQHMTNTRITDVEEMEKQFPIQIMEFSIRNNSGGEGRFKGGEGIKRVYRFLEKMTLTIISQHRNEAPYGLNGGNPGKVGKQWLIKKDGSLQALEGVDTVEVEAGDTFVLMTPGGGGSD